jgi:hypothetical protein
LVVLVNLLDWSPRRATEPFLWIGGLYTVASLPMVMIASRRRYEPMGEPPPPALPPILQDH